MKQYSTVMQYTCVRKLHLLSHAFTATFIVGFRASYWMVLLEIAASVLDAAPLSLRFTFSVIFQDSQYFICSVPIERLATLRRSNFLPLFSVLYDFDSSPYI